MLDNSLIELRNNLFADQIDIFPNLLGWSQNDSFKLSLALMNKESKSSSIWNHCFNCPSRFEKGLLLFIIQADFFVPQARPQCIFVQSLKTFLFPPSLCFRAKEIGCNNADHPDKYGHYREAKFTMTKHHWWWKVSNYSSSCLPEAVP